jgi:hypothetical protein
LKRTLQQGSRFSSIRIVHSHNQWVTPDVAKVGGLQSQGAKGEAVVNLLRTIGNAGSGVLRLSRRVTNMASNRLHPLNSPEDGNQKGKHFYELCLKLE